MPTLGEACTQLRVSRRTLDKWLKRLEIEPQKHPRDWRYFTITDDQVQQIREARAEMPGAQSVPYTRNTPLGSPALGAYVSTRPPAPRPAASHHREPEDLPVGAIWLVDLARECGMNTRTARDHADAGTIPAQWVPDLHREGHRHWYIEADSIERVRTFWGK